MRNRRGFLANTFRFQSGAMVFLCVFLSLVAMAPAVTVTYTYDSAGRLVAVDTGDGQFIDYRYDPAGNLLSRLAGAGLPGNVHPDAVVDLTDAIKALQAAARLSPGAVTARADVDGDQAVGIGEAVYVLQRIASLR